MNNMPPNGYYPVVMQVKGRRCLIVGGGVVAERKLAGLLEAGADNVLLISPEAVPAIQSAAAAGRIVWERRPYSAGDAQGARIVFAATDDNRLNEEIAREAERLGIPANVADAAGKGSFITPSVVRRGDLIIAVTASGASPAMSARLKRELEAQYGERYGAAVERLGRLRRAAMLEAADETLRRQVLKLAADEALEQEYDGDDKDGEATLEWLASLIERVSRS